MNCIGLPPLENSSAPAVHTRHAFRTDINDYLIFVYWKREKKYVRQATMLSAGFSVFGPGHGLHISDRAFFTC